MRRIHLVIAMTIAIGAAISMVARRASVSGASGGRAVYVAKCYACHAIDGSGDNTIGRSLKLRDIRPAIRRMTDEQLRRVIVDGRGRMERIKKIDDQQISSLTLFLRDLADGKPDNGRAAAEDKGRLLPHLRDTYRDKCSACHALNGTGQTTVGRSLKTPDLTSPDVQIQSVEQLAEVITKGRGRMPSYAKTFNSAQVGQLVNYILKLGKGTAEVEIAENNQTTTPTSQPATREEARAWEAEPKLLWASDQSFKSGRQIYRAKCSACHSLDGSGAGLIGQQMAVPDLRSQQVQWLSDEALGNIIRNGIGRVHTRNSNLQQVRLLVDYLRELGKNH